MYLLYWSETTIYTRQIWNLKQILRSLDQSFYVVVSQFIKIIQSVNTSSLTTQSSKAGIQIQLFSPKSTVICHYRPSSIRAVPFIINWLRLIAHFHQSATKSSAYNQNKNDKVPQLYAIGCHHVLDSGDDASQSFEWSGAPTWWVWWCIFAMLFIVHIGVLIRHNKQYFWKRGSKNRFVFCFSCFVYETNRSTNRIRW